MQTVKIGEVSRLDKGKQVNMSMTERLQRKGPFPYYADNGQASNIEDYTLEAGGVVIVPAYGTVLGSNGYVMAQLEEGRCSFGEPVHALLPNDPADARYLWRAICNSPSVARQVGGSAQLRQLGAGGLLSSRIPWPCRATRDAFVQMLDDLDASIAELIALPKTLLEQGDEAFARIVGVEGAPTATAGEVARWSTGTNVPAAERAYDKAVRVEGPRGVLGRCDDALAQGPAVMVGPAGRVLLTHYVGEPSHPIAEMTFACACDTDLPLSVLLFALRAAGLPDRPQAYKRGDKQGCTPDAFSQLELVVGTEETRARFAEVGDEILAALVKAEADLESQRALRREQVDVFNEYGVVNGSGSCEGCESAAGDIPPVPEAPALPEAVPAEVANAALLDACGPLRPIVEAGLALLGNPSDLAWELAPLAVLRVCASESQWAFVQAGAGPFAAPDYARLVGILDTVMTELAQADDLLSFLPNLSYGSSLLSAPQLAEWVAGLSQIDPADIGGEHIRALFALDPECRALPAGVRQVFEGAVRAAADMLPEGFATGYIPYDSWEGTTDLFSSALPDVTLRAQYEEFPQLLTACLVRAVGLAGSRDTRGGLGAAACQAIASDEFADWKADLVAAVFPANQADWSNGAVKADDPRWSVLGVPPRNKANFAWLEQALYHQAPGGCSVLLLSNPVLHSTFGSEPKLRDALVSQRRAKAVVSLPARLFGDGRSAMSVVVLGDEGSAQECLMVNALGMGVSTADPALRELSADVAGRIVSVLRAWLVEGGRPEEPGFCRVVSAQEIEGAEGMLTPWSFL